MCGHMWLGCKHKNTTMVDPRTAKLACMSTWRLTLGKIKEESPPRTNPIGKQNELPFCK